MPFQRHTQNMTAWWSRLSFPKIWEPAPVKVKGAQIGEPRFSALIVLTDRALAEIRAIEADLITKSWPEGLPPDIQVKSCLRRGEIHRPEDANLKGKFYVSANSSIDWPKHTRDPNDPSVKAAIDQARPRVFTKTADGNRAETLNRSLVYSGCEAHVRLGIYTTQLNAAEPQVNVGLNLIELTGRQLPSFGGMETADQAFGDEADAPPPPMVEGAIDAPPTYAATGAPAMTDEEAELAAMGLS